MRASISFAAPTKSRTSAMQKETVKSTSGLQLPQPTAGEQSVKRLALFPCRKCTPPPSSVQGNSASAQRPAKKGNGSMQAGSMVREVPATKSTPMQREGLLQAAIQMLG